MISWLGREDSNLTHFGRQLIVNQSKEHALFAQVISRVLQFTNTFSSRPKSRRWRMLLIEDDPGACIIIAGTDRFQWLP